MAPMGIRARHRHHRGQARVEHPHLSGAGRRQRCAGDGVTTAPKTNASEDRSEGRARTGGPTPAGQGTSESRSMTLTPELPGTDVVTGRWLTDHSWNRPSWTVAELEAAKAGRTISVVLPALNEEETVGSVVETITPLLGGLVDELIVLDSGSTDDTEIRAVAAGARVI